MKESQTIRITDRSNACFNIYLRDINHIKPLDAKTELSLAKAAQNGDLKARNQLVESNLRYIISVAKDYMLCRIEINDLIEAGNEGLIEAIEGFDTSRGYRLLTYADDIIRNRMKKAILNQHVVHIPEKEYALLCSNETDRPIFESLDVQVSDEDEETRAERIEAYADMCADYELCQTSSMDYLMATIGSLPANRARAIRLRYGLEDVMEYTDETIASYMGISRERARQLCEDGEKRLAALLENDVA